MSVPRIVISARRQVELSQIQNSLQAAIYPTSIRSKINRGIQPVPDYDSAAAACELPWPRSAGFVRESP